MAKCWLKVAQIVSSTTLVKGQMKVAQALTLNLLMQKNS